MKGLLVIILKLGLATLSQSFSLTEVTPKEISVIEGEDVTFSCAVDTYYEWCTFIHNDKKCDYVWKRDYWNVTVEDCNDYQGRIEYTGNYDYYNCAIILKSVTLEDIGEWSCELESYHVGKYRGYGYQVKGTMFLAVFPTPTTHTGPFELKSGKKYEKLSFSKCNFQFTIRCLTLWKVGNHNLLEEMGPFCCTCKGSKSSDFLILA